MLALSHHQSGNPWRPLQRRSLYGPFLGFHLLQVYAVGVGPHTPCVIPMDPFNIGRSLSEKGEGQIAGFPGRFRYLKVSREYSLVGRTDIQHVNTLGIHRRHQISGNAHSSFLQTHPFYPLPTQNTIFCRVRHSIHLLACGVTFGVQGSPYIITAHKREAPWMGTASLQKLLKKGGRPAHLV